ncbi:MAG: DoxX protein [Acidobacteriota bacterium]|nr:DoxX protein [Acidobacteriota bacterium]
MRNDALQTAFLRFALAAGFLSAVADRFGLWGPYGKLTVAWGDMTHFLPYVGKLNPWFPNAMIPIVGWAATIAEVALGALLLIGLQTRWAARLSGCLLLAFAIAMTLSTGIKTALDYSVFAASGGAFVLAAAGHYPWSVDTLRKRRM